MAQKTDLLISSLSKGLGQIIEVIAGSGDGDEAEVDYWDPEYGNNSGTDNQTRGPKACGALVRNSKLDANCGVIVQKSV